MRINACYLSLAIAAAAVMAITACGRTKPSPSSATTVRATSTAASKHRAPATRPSGGKSLTQAELIARADTICRRMNTTRAQITIAGWQDYARYVPALAQYEQQAVTALRALVPPTATDASWRQMLGATEQMAKSTAEFGRLAVAKDRRAASQLFPVIERATKQESELARKAGFHDCARLA